MSLVGITSAPVPTSDVLSGGLIILGFLFVAYWIGKLLGRANNTRFAKAWKPLMAIIDGTIVYDGAGSDTSWLTGTYQGYKVRASMSPGSNKYTMSHNSYDRYNSFNVQLLDQPGKQDWKIHNGTQALGVSRQGWAIQAPFALQEQLNREGVMDHIKPMGNPVLSYREQPQALQLSDDVTPQWAPNPERFKQQLDLLVYLAKVNQQVNTK